MENGKRRIGFVSNRFFITVLVVIALFFGAFALTRHKSTSGSSSASSSQPTNHVEGGGKSGVVLIEYGDYQCPACGEYYPILKQVYAKYQDQITFQFRNFPLIQIHQNAFAGARAAEAAGKQNKYWEMHDLLYENQQTWGVATNPTTYFVAYAQQLGLDTTKFQADMNSQDTNNAINADITAGQKIGADATPTFVLDGQKVASNPPTLDAFNALIDSTIKAKTGH